MVSKIEHDNNRVVRTRIVLKIVKRNECFIFSTKLFCFSKRILLFLFYTSIFAKYQLKSKKNNALQLQLSSLHHYKTLYNNRCKANSELFEKN